PHAIVIAAGERQRQRDLIASDPVAGKLPTRHQLDEAIPAAGHGRLRTVPEQVSPESLQLLRCYRLVLAEGKGRQAASLAAVQLGVAYCAVAPRLIGERPADEDRAEGQGGVAQNADE